MKDLVEKVFPIWIKQLLYFAYVAPQKLVFELTKKFIKIDSDLKEKLFILTPSLSDSRVKEILTRCQFYVPGKAVEVIELSASGTLPLELAFSEQPLLHFDETRPNPNWIYRSRGGVFNVDYLNYSNDGWAWHGLLSYLAEPNRSLISESQNRLIKKIKDLQKESFDKCYVFGTGPSLERAIDRDWSDGYRIVCNTIVRDPELWHHLNPHFIVAGDAIYHFGHTAFARAFRADLSQRLSESNTAFVYPIQFHELVSREFATLTNQLIPIPPGASQAINIDLTQNFSLPALGNVLLLLLLPLACTLSKNIYLFGFDGRAPNDQLFWSNSNKHTYSELMDSLKLAHPAFFDHYLTKDDPLKYVKSYHGDTLDQNLNKAESQGWKFVMMHQTWTPTLQKRYSVFC